MKPSKDIRSNTPNRAIYLLALALFLAVVGLFASLADEVHDGDTKAFDTSVLIAIRDVAGSPALDAVMKVVTDFGGVVAIVVFTALIAAFMWSKRMYSRTAVLLLSMGGIAAAVTVLKVIFARERPTDVGAIVSESSFSFPSGHSMGSMGLALTVILLLWPTKWRTIAVVVGTLYVLVIGFSRMYLGVHFPTDVAAGYLLGAGWVTLVYLLFKSNRRFNI